MGYLRVFLALAVFYTHVDAPIQALKFTGGSTAVEAFFVVSGYFIAQVLEKKKYSSTKKFYLSRILRIFPTFLIASVIALSHILVITKFGASRGQNFSPVSFLPNLLIIFQDLCYFLDSGIHIIPGLQQTLVLGVAWTLSLELYFYLVSPLLLKIKTRHLLLACFTLLVSKVALFAIVGLNPFFANRFFIFEFGFYLLGYISYRSQINIAVSKVAAFLVFLMPIVFPLWKYGNQFGPHAWEPMLYPIIVALSLPYLMKIDMHCKLSVFLGRISFPIYLFHVPIAAWYVSLVSFSGYPVPPKITGVVILATTIGVSYISLRLVEDKINNYRSKLATI